MFQRSTSPFDYLAGCPSPRRSLPFICSVALIITSTCHTFANKLSRGNKVVYFGRFPRRSLSYFRRCSSLGKSPETDTRKLISCQLATEAIIGALILSTYLQMKDAVMNEGSLKSQLFFKVNRLLGCVAALVSSDGVKPRWHVARSCCALCLLLPELRRRRAETHRHTHTHI